jgi:soluble lytic murein transglycosylase
MSSMVTRLSISALLLAGSSASVADMAAQSSTAAPMARPAMVQAVPATDPALNQAIAQWRSLRQTDSLPFSSYANFLVAHPGWPGETAMRRTAERAIGTDGFSAAQVVAYFDRFSPLTNEGHARHAEALNMVGRRDEARAAARKAWTSGSLSTIDEARMLTQFGGTFTGAEHDERMDRLLWAGATTAATRQVALTSPANRPLFEARLAMRARAADAAAKSGAVLARGMTDAGFIADRATWLRATGQSNAARALLAGQRRLTNRPGDVEKWYEVLLENARGAAADRQYSLAYDIASKVDDAYPAGTVVRDRPLGERDDYTSLVWLAGMTALENLRRPADAERMFTLYAEAAQSPQTQTKGHYWAGRAAVAAGRNAASHFEAAALHPDQFYGMLSLERLGRPITAPALAQVQPAAAARAAFNNREVVRAARLLGQQGNWSDQTQFVRQIAADATSATDHALAGELAAAIGRPDLAVMVGRSARANGEMELVRLGYPQVRVPPGHERNWTMIHAIIRQESQFDRAAVSVANARGLMQLIPGTARDQSAKIGRPFNPAALTTDTNYNIQLGSSYFQRRLSDFSSHPLALAAYNGGAGNVAKWLREYGDPRLAGGDIVRWIENIPFAETRGYVQRVLENAVMYDVLHPDKAQVRSATPLSTYLGKSKPG